MVHNPAPARSQGEALVPLTRTALAARLESGRPVELTTQGTSMVPFLHAGDQVRIVAVEPGQLRLGDVIAFWRGEEVVVHRFAGWAGGALREKGDNLRGWNPVPREDLLGRVDLVRTRAGERTLDGGNLVLGCRAWCLCLIYPWARRLYHLLKGRP